MSDPRYLSKEEVATLLPMDECIAVMKDAFSNLADGKCLQPLRSLMWLPDRKGLLGMMPGYAAGPGVMGIKVITVFHGNRELGLPSHQGTVTLFDAANGKPLLIADAMEITSIRTAAASALATSLLAREDSTKLAIIGTGEQAERHIEAISLVKNISEVFLWGRNEEKADKLARKLSARYKFTFSVMKSVAETVQNADIICTVTSSSQPVLMGDWLQHGTHINAVGACTPNVRELDTKAVQMSVLFTDSYESLFSEAGDFLIPKKENAIDNNHVRAELSELVSGSKKGRTDKDEITIFKSLGIAAEDIFSASHIYNKIKSAL
jgi:ornithine cyclodeaminase